MHTIVKATILSVIFFGSFTAAIAQSNAKGFIGLALADVPGSAGALVEMVKPGGPADQAGVKPGDIVVAINGTAVGRASTMTRIIGAMAPSQTARLSVIRRSGLSAQHLTIAVTIGSLNAASETVPNSAQRPTPAPTSSTRSPAPIPSAAAAKSTNAALLSVSNYVRLTDPLEQAFTVEVPSGWNSVGALARQAALQINPYVRSLSPDKMTYLLLGDPTLPSFSPPSQMGNAIGHPEGTLYDAGLGGRALVLRYLPGSQFARSYGETMLQGLCPSLKFASSQDRPDLATKASALWPTVIPSVANGGEATFTCTHNKQEMEARVEAVTRITRDNIIWAVILLQGFIAPRAQSNTAEEILNHVAGSVTFSQAWMQKQNGLSQQAAIAINQRMQDTLRQERKFIQSLNSVDENFESMDEIVSGFSTYHDEKTGTNYSLSNTNPNKWIDDSTGRILSTPTNSKPPWASAYRALPRGSN
jgi:PDZ domain